MPSYILYVYGGIFGIGLLALLWGFYQPFRRDFIRAFIRMPDRTLQKVWTKRKIASAEAEGAKHTIETFVHKGVQYHVLPTYIYPMGWQRVPTALYIYGRFEPVALTDNPAIEHGLSGKDFYDAIEAHVAADVINALKPKSAITIGMSLIIMIGVVLLAVGFLYMQGGKQIDGLREDMYLLHGVPPPGSDQIPPTASPYLPAK